MLKSHADEKRSFKTRRTDREKREDIPGKTFALPGILQPISAKICRLTLLSVNSGQPQSDPFFTFPENRSHKHEP